MMNHDRPRSLSLPELPLLLWDTPPGLELALTQEGVAFKNVRHAHPLAFQSGRFVLFDGGRVSASAVRAMLSPDHVAIDIDGFRGEGPGDPFPALVDTKSGMGVWTVRGSKLRERVARADRATVRRRLIAGIRDAVTSAGGTWARLSAYPFPFRSAFNFRADLDETEVDDYARFANARRGLDDCVTHFVSTRAYGQEPGVLADLRRHDTQSHGHHHVIYREPEANRKNLARAHDLLCASGIEPVGFAAPHGRWNPGLDSVIEGLGYLYSSDFSIGRDDLPFYPWLGDRFSRVLQVPIHPVCEGLFFEAGVTSGRLVAEHLVRVALAKIDAGEPAFVYGHPEGRLARHPEVLAMLADAVAGHDLLWRVTLTEFARWWRWRAGRSWSLVARGDGRLELQLDDWSADYPLGVEIHRGRHAATVPLRGPRTPIKLDDLAYELRAPFADIPTPRFPAEPISLKAAVRSALDWETVTPIDELPSDSLAGRVKKGLRVWRHHTKVAS